MCQCASSLFSLSSPACLMIARETVRQRQRDRNRQTDRDSDRQRDTERQRQTERERLRQRETHRETETNRQRHGGKCANGRNMDLVNDSTDRRQIILKHSVHTAPFSASPPSVMNNQGKGKYRQHGKYRAIFSLNNFSNEEPGKGPSNLFTPVNLHWTLSSFLASARSKLGALNLSIFAPRAVMAAGCRLEIEPMGELVAFREIATASRLAGATSRQGSSIVQPSHTGLSAFSSSWIDLYYSEGVQQNSA